MMKKKIEANTNKKEEELIVQNRMLLDKINLQDTTYYRQQQLILMERIVRALENLKDFLKDSEKEPEKNEE